jgi:hypothetical protein
MPDKEHHRTLGAFHSEPESQKQMRGRTAVRPATAVTTPTTAKTKRIVIEKAPAELLTRLRLSRFRSCCYSVAFRPLTLGFDPVARGSGGEVPAKRPYVTTSCRNR